MAEARRFLSRREVASQVGLCLATVDNLIRAGRIPSAKLANRRLIPKEWLDELTREALQRR